MRSLIVEDDFASRTVLQRFLMEYGDTEVAADGKTAMALFKDSLAKGPRFDLICLDIMLPETSGLTLLEDIRALEAAGNVPVEQAAQIFMVSALSDKETVVSAIKLCDAYLVKPIRMADLITNLKRVNLIP